VNPADEELTVRSLAVPVLRVTVPLVERVAAEPARVPISPRSVPTVSLISITGGMAARLVPAELPVLTK